jgi:hypothetical protein
MRELAQARELIEPIATARRNRGHPVTAEHVDRAARLLADLWAAAARHRVTPAQAGWTVHLPRAAFDATAAAIRAEQHRSIHAKPGSTVRAG